MVIEDVMSRSVVTLQPQQTLRDAIDLLRSKHIRHLPVVEGGKLVGIVSDRDVKRTTPSLVGGIERDEYDEALDTTKVSRFMTRDPITVSPGTSLKAAVAIFIEKKVGALPVIGADAVLEGIVTEIDLLRVFHGMLSD
jgi:acetoin utilization protein AcuB